MRTLIPRRELEALGEGMVRDYFNRKQRRDPVSVDIEDLVTDYLHLNLVYERFLTDSCAVGFCADGITPLRVERGEWMEEVVYPKGTIVVHKVLFGDRGRRRFTTAHEAAHSILSRHAPLQAALFSRSWDSETYYGPEDLRRDVTVCEMQANRLAAAILMPRFLVEKSLAKYWEGKIPCYDGVLAQEAKLAIRKTADDLGVNYSAMKIRLRELGVLEERPLPEYLEHGLQLGGRL